ncbi:MAG: hypothetical protein ACRDJF_01625 [Actinomycetota bacterium]
MIRLGSLAGYSFEGPYTLAGWTPPDKSAVYVILYKPDPDQKPNTYAVIDLGHTANLSEEGFPSRHPRSRCWIGKAGSAWKVFVAYFYLPGASDTPSIRAGIVRELSALYDPDCYPEKFDLHWKDEWIGEYQSTLTAGLGTSRDARDHPTKGSVSQ